MKLSRIKKVGFYFTTLLAFFLATSCSSIAPWSDNASNDSDESHAAPARDPASDQLKNAQIRRAMMERDIVVGMKMEDVRDVWGEPARVEVPALGYEGNQRWLYYMGLSTRWSIDPVRIVYFENGEVVGWDTVDR